jgi:chemotaxis protein MotB
MARGKNTGRYTPRRRGGEEKQDKSGAWLTTYADAVTLLMAFFVMLYAMSEVDTLKFTAFLQGLQVPFGNEAGEGLLPKTDGLQPEDTPRPPMDIDESPVSIDESDQVDVREVPEPAIPIAEVAADIVEALERRDAAHDQLDVVAAALTEALQARELDLLVEQRREERGLVVSVASDDVLFSLGSTAISPVGRDVIEVVAETLDGFPNPLLVEGHTDDLPLDRSGYTNWNLSTDRAVAVLQLMIDEHRLPPQRVGAVGYGEHHPLADNDAASGRARNRRVDIVVLIEESFL